MFVTPLVQHGPSSTKRPRLIPAISPDEGRENSPTRGGDSSPAGESPGGKQCNSSTTEEKLKDMSTVATSGEQMMELVREKRVLEATLKIKEEQLRKLKMVQVYRTKVCLSVSIDKSIHHKYIILLPIPGTVTHVVIVPTSEHNCSLNMAVCSV